MLLCFGYSWAYISDKYIYIFVLHPVLWTHCNIFSKSLCGSLGTSLRVPGIELSQASAVALPSVFSLAP